MYQITVNYDGKPVPDFTFKYSDARQAFQEFEKYVDWGFADEYSTVNLLMPTGKMYTKVLNRNGSVVER
jgi:hypothetical protein